MPKYLRLSVILLLFGLAACGSIVGENPLLPQNPNIQHIEVEWKKSVAESKEKTVVSLNGKPGTFLKNLEKAMQQNLAHKGSGSAINLKLRLHSVLAKNGGTWTELMSGPRVSAAGIFAIYDAADKAYATPITEQRFQFKKKLSIKDVQGGTDRERIVIKHISELVADQLGLQ